MGTLHEQLHAATAVTDAAFPWGAVLWSAVGTIPALVALVTVVLLVAWSARTTEARPPAKIIGGTAAASILSIAAALTCFAHAL